MRIEYENLNAISNQLEAFKKMGPTPEEYLLASIATSLAQIADVMVNKAESEPQKRSDKE